MRTLMIALLVAGLMSTVGVYAASITGSAKTVGGTGSVAVSAPTGASVSVAYNITTGQVVSVDVTWTPSADSDYDLDVEIGASTGTLNVPTSGTVQRTDTVTISPNIDAESVTTAEVVITEN
mgnify:CR=1 FL=1